MKNQIVISTLTSLMIISGCKAQSTSNNNSVKNRKNMERTTEKFDTATYYMNRKGRDYQFENYSKALIPQRKIF